MKRSRQVIGPIVILVVLLFYSFPSYGQLDESDTAKFQLRGGINGAWQQGNVNLLVLRGRLELVSNSEKAWVVKSQTNSLYQEFGGNQADNDLYSRNYLYFKPFRKFYPFALVFAQTNYRREIRFRAFGGLGYTWQVIQRPKMTLKLSGSLVYETTHFRNDEYNEPGYNGEDIISLPRGTIYLAGWQRFVDSKLRLTYSGYWQPGFDDFPNNRFQLDLGVEFPIWKGLAINALYTWSQEQVVASGVVQKDRILSFGLSYQLKKINS